MTKAYISNYLQETADICSKINQESIYQLAELISFTRNAGGRIFIAGVGGSAANASHAVNDFRKIIKVEAHSMTENVSELTARINDDGWNSSLVETLKIFNPTSNDSILIFSVGGGSENTSKNLVELMKYGKRLECKLGAVVSRDGGYAKKICDVCVHIPIIHPSRITPHAEEMQGVVWHLISSLLGEV